MSARCTSTKLSDRSCSFPVNFSIRDDIPRPRGAFPARGNGEFPLNDAIALAARGLHKPGAPLSQTVIVRAEDAAGSPLALDILPLPSSTLGFSQPRVVVVVRGPRGGNARKSAILQSLYGLTGAETEIALQLAEGATPEAIARARAVAIGTVRAQIKSVLAKLGVRRQVELVARLNSF